MTQPEAMLLGAIELVKGGWRVFPVSPQSKRPITEHGHLDATVHQEVVREWWSKYPWAAIATPTGDGLLVIDVDPRNGGSRPTWAPSTLTVRTQSGGLHLYYKVDEDIKSKAGLFGRGVDSKSRGGYVLVPPSPGYHWEDIRPRAALKADDLRVHFEETYVPGDGSVRLPPEQWYRGIIHDQALTWAAYFAGQLEDEDDVVAAVWAMVDQARAAGVQIDNARDHIGSAIRWVLRREASERAANRPNLA